MTPAAARGGFKAALRHTARVRWLRRVAIAGSLLAITLIATAALLNPLRRLPGELSIGRVGVEGHKSHRGISENHRRSEGWQPL